MKSPLLLLVIFLPGACTVGVSESDGKAEPGISCSQDQSCPADMNCVTNVCQLKQATITSVLVEVTLPSSANLGRYSGLGFVLPLDVPTEGSSDITLPTLSDLKFDTSFQTVPDKGLGCDYTRVPGDSRTVQATLAHRWPVDGLEKMLMAASDLPANFTSLPAKYDRTPYLYEVYLTLSTTFKESLGSIDPGCRLPPALFRDVKVDGQTTMTLNWPAPKALAVDVQIPSTLVANGGDLQDWSLNVVDPVQGRELALPSPLGPATTDPSDPTVSHYRATLTYNPIASIELSPPAHTELLRLQPKSGDVRHTFYVALSTLSLFSSTGESVFALNSVPEAVTLTGRVETADKFEPVEAQITVLSANSTATNDGLWADYRTTTQSDAMGQFQVTLPAGEYRVLAVPTNDGLHAVLDTKWTVRATPLSQGGRLLVIPLLSEVVGSIQSQVRWGTSASASIQAIPSSQLTYDPSAKAAAVHFRSPAARTASLLFRPSESSSFALATDPGYYDISLHPPDGSPWIVTPGFHIAAGSTTLAPWTLPLPVQWAGHLRAPETGSIDNPNLGDLPRAVLRVFALLGSDRQPVLDAQAAESIVQIAEARAGADGSFNLILPDQIQPQ